MAPPRRRRERSVVASEIVLPTCWCPLRGRLGHSRHLSYNNEQPSRVKTVKGMRGARKAAYAETVGSAVGKPAEWGRDRLGHSAVGLPERRSDRRNVQSGHGETTKSCRAMLHVEVVLKRDEHAENM